MKYSLLFLTLMISLQLVAKTEIKTEVLPKAKGPELLQKKDAKSTFVDISADDMVYRYKGQPKYILMSNNFLLVTTEYKLTAECASVYMNADGKTPKTAIADGNVKLVTKEYVVTGQHAVWQDETKDIVITGSPHVSEKSGMQFSGTKIRYDMKTRTLKMTGNKKTRRSRIVIPSKLVTDKNNFLKKAR